MGEMQMRPLFALSVLALLLVTGCLPNPVSVSKDGTIALTLSETGEYSLIQGELEQVYLTNANADFLEKVEGLEKCRSPVISPSGKYVLACSENELLLHDRETKKTRAIYRPRGDSGGSFDFPVWSPNEKKIAFFAERFASDEFPALCVYDVKRRELEVLARNVSPQAAWLPDSKRLLYFSFPEGITENGAAALGDLNVIQVNTLKKKTVVRGQLFYLSGLAVFPEGRAVLFPHLDWEGVEISPAGMTVPIVLRKELLASATKKTAPQPPARNEGVPDAAASESRGTPASPEQMEESLIIREGQPFFPMTYAVSPDGKKIACVRYVWESGPSEERPATSEAESAAPEENAEPLRGLEFCVVGADGTGMVAVLRCLEEENAQVLWVSDSRLLCLTQDTIIAVDADGKNPLNLTETLRTKFADQFKPLPTPGSGG
jgi:hypothetical protein